MDDTKGPQMLLTPEEEVAGGRAATCDKGRLRDFGEDARRQEQPEGQELVLIYPTLERKSQEWPVSREDRDRKVRVLQVDRCKPI